jgi:hypothetical protein
MIAEPVKRVYAAFLIGLGYLLVFLGAKDWGKSLVIRGGRVESGLQGVWAYGRRFLIASVNYGDKCRGSCYWIIHRYLRGEPLRDLAKGFEEGPPAEAAQMHDQKLIPADLVEEKIWEHRVGDTWPPFPRLDPGVYTFCIGFSDGARKAHRIAFFNRNESLLFDPNTGLSQWEPSDWAPLLSRIGDTIRTSHAPTGFFTIECYSYGLV